MAGSTVIEGIPMIRISQHTYDQRPRKDSNFEKGGLRLVSGASWADSMIFASRFRPE
jgi:hypothetical protein